MSQKTKFDTFAALHTPGDPVVLFNIWDAGSARAVEKAGAKAIATGSYSVAEANGYSDGESTPLDLVAANASRIAASVDLPVSIDFETGYGDTPDEAAASLEKLAQTGVVGVNIEDGLIGGALRAVEDQSARLKGLADIEASVWINARTDVFLQTAPDDHGDHIDEALERGAAYADAGANSFFVPGLTDPVLIAKVCESASLPVNVMAGSNSPSIGEFAQLGVGRVSFGPYPWRQAMKNLADAARDVFGVG
ncbi:MAG: isocitrate lyase/phosphoenolpyruvate mutase family protein [Pseudomonadota bacterium]